MNISFKANFVSSQITLPQCNNPEEAKVSFVKLDFKDVEDMRAMNKIANDYTRIVNIQNRFREEPKCANYFADIRNHFNKAYVSPNYYPNSNFFALTTQQDTFEYLDNKQVCGLAEIYHNPLSNYIELKYLQVNPLHKHSEPTREYKKVGTRLLDYIRAYFPEKDIHLISDYGVVDFYKKYGFKSLRGNQMILKCM